MVLLGRFNGGFCTLAINSARVFEPSSVKLVVIYLLDFVKAAWTIKA